MSCAPSTTPPRPSSSSATRPTRAGAAARAGQAARAGAGARRSPRRRSRSQALQQRSDSWRPSARAMLKDSNAMRGLGGRDDHRARRAAEAQGGGRGRAWASTARCSRSSARLIDAGKLKVRIVEGRMVVVLASDVLFASGSATLSKDGKAAIAEVGQAARLHPATGSSRSRATPTTCPSPPRSTPPTGSSPPRAPSTS